MSSFFPKGVNTNSLFLERNNKKGRTYSRGGWNQKVHLWVFVVELAMAVLLGVVGKDAWDICVCEGGEVGGWGRLGSGPLSEAHPGLQLLIIFCADSYQIELSPLFPPYHLHHKYISLSLSSLLNMVQIELVIFTLPVLLYTKQKFLLAIRPSLGLPSCHWGD